jgi:hypothetical protein
MSTAVREQIRQLAAAFDEVVDNITAAEVSGRVGTPITFHDVEHQTRDVLATGSRPSARRLSIAAVWVLIVVGVVGTLVWVERNGPPPSATRSPSTTGSAAAPAAFGQFVWPAPPRNFATLDDLVGAFATEVLAWDAWDVVGDVNGTFQPQVFTLAGSSVDASVRLVAIPSPEGWGFVQIGETMSASAEQPGDLVLTVPIGVGAESGSVVIRLSDGTTRESTDLTGQVVFSGVRVEDLVSALAVGRDADGRALSAVGGVFRDDSAPAATVPGSVPGSTMTVDAEEGVAYGPFDYATTERVLPMWPEVNLSDPAATTSGYGMQLCDSGYGTKILRVDPASGPSHAYSGTLCVFIDLAQARVDAVTTCATSTDRFNYARCQRRTDQTDTTGAGTSERALADAEEMAAMQAFPSATAWDQSELFDASVSAASASENSRTFRDGSVTVTLDAATDSVVHATVDPPGVCFEIKVPGATAQGCVGHDLLATGLAYGAFQDGDGPIELVGIVPDEVIAIEVDGQIVTPTNNVWHYTATSGAPLTVTVRSADGRTATTGLAGRTSSAGT